MTNRTSIARSAAAAIVAATLLAAAPATAQTSGPQWGMSLVGSHTVSSVGARGETITTVTERYRNAKGRTRVVIRTVTSGPAQHTGQYGQPAHRIPEPQVYPEIDPDWAPAPQVYPEIDPDWRPAPQVYPAYRPDWTSASHPAPATPRGQGQTY